jgi:hypothetical protein
MGREIVAGSERYNTLLQQFVKIANGPALRGKDAATSAHKLMGDYACCTLLQEALKEQQGKQTVFNVLFTLATDGQWEVVAAIVGTPLNAEIPEKDAMRGTVSVGFLHSELAAEFQSEILNKMPKDILGKLKDTTYSVDGGNTSYEYDVISGNCRSSWR